MDKRISKDSNDDRRTKEDQNPRPRGLGSKRQDQGVFFDNRPPLQPLIYHTYTSFNTPKLTILQEIYSTGLINLPPAPMFQSSQVDKKKTCEYHVGFQDLLEGLARSGRLDRYIQRGSRQPPPLQQKPGQEERLTDPSSNSTQIPEQTMPIRGIINMIVGGFM